MDTRRAANPPLSAIAQQSIATYSADLQRIDDVRPTTLRNYLSDLRLFVAWLEADEGDGRGEFRSATVTTAVLTRYRSYLQDERHLKPASVNRSLVSLKRYFGWATQNGQIVRDPARAVKLVGRQESAPRHLSQKEEDALIAAVTTHGSLRDRTLVTLMLHTGLRAAEVCHLQRTEMRDYAAARRYCLMLCLIQQERVRVRDDCAEMFVKRMAHLHTRAKEELVLIRGLRPFSVF